MSRSQVAILVTGLAVFGLTAGVNADESAIDLSQDDLVREWMNPIGRLSIIDNRFEYRRYNGDLPDSGSQNRSGYVLSGVVPFEFDSGRRLALRLAMPISFSTPTWVQDGRDHADWLIRQRADTFTEDGHFIKGHGHLDDLSYSAAYGGTEDSGLFWMAGLAGVLPTSQDGSIERDQYLLGPEFALGKTYDWGLVGAWGRHLVDVASQSRGEQQRPVDWNTSETNVRLLFAYRLGNGWNLVSNPEIIYDWEGLSGNRLLLPFGGGLARTFRMGRVPVLGSVEAYYYAVSPDAFGPEWQLNLSISPVLGFWSLD